MKRAIVLGLGVSGKAACRLLLKRGIGVAAFDENQSAYLSQDAKALEATGVTFLKEVNFTEFDVLILSPGVPPVSPVYLEAKRFGLPLIGEAEFALQGCTQPCIAVTGTNGKTTVTALIAHVLNFTGRKAKAVGNIGVALSDYFLQADKEEILVIELSSYQLETLHSQLFDAGVILNITPDHLDRYLSMEEYAKAKCKLQDCLKKEAPLFVHESVLPEFGHLLHRPYTSYAKPGEDHDAENNEAAWLIVSCFGVTKKEFESALKSFKKQPHRIEWVACIDGVTYINDSKGTNLDAVLKAIAKQNGKVHLIAGGLDKGSSYQLWTKPFSNKVKRIYALGQAADKIVNELSPFFDIEKVENLEKAVDRASELAVAGEVVLLSPGCASWDMFKDYAHRGEVFKKRVLDLQERRRRG